MTEPDPRPTAAMSRALPEADLSALKAHFAAASRSAPAPPPAASPPAASDSPVIDVTDATFQAEVVERSLQVPVIVDLWASWCGPCTQLSPMLERLARETNGAWILAKVNADHNPYIARLLSVQSIPMVVAILRGHPVDAFRGLPPEAEIQQWLSALLDASAS